MKPNKLHQSVRICGKKVRDWKTLKKSVTWDQGEKQGLYMHSRCFIDSVEYEREVIRALLSMKEALKEMQRGKDGSDE